MMEHAPGTDDTVRSIEGSLDAFAAEAGVLHVAFLTCLLEVDGADHLWLTLSWAPFLLLQERQRTRALPRVMLPPAESGIT
jgi:hypothetical protein